MGYSLYMDSRSRNEFLPPSRSDLTAVRIPRPSRPSWTSLQAASDEAVRAGVGTVEGWNRFADAQNSTPAAKRGDDVTATVCRKGAR